MIDLRELQRTKQAFAGRYQLEKQLGKGGFSEVWLAYDETSRVHVALKIYVSDGCGLDDEGMAIFREEFTIVCNINHTNLLRPFLYDTVGGHPFLVLPYCEKGSSSRLIGKMDEEQLWSFVRDVASGLDYLHNHTENYIVHQDIKPDNILVTGDGQYVITDFGISTQLKRTMRRSMRRNDGGTGTLAYMGPERFGESAMPLMANDIWSLGATLYELATGVLPFGEEGGINQKRGATVPKIEKDYSSGLKRLIYSCLEKEPWDRPTAGDLVKSCANRSLFRHSWTEKISTSVKGGRRSLFYVLPVVLVALAVWAFGGKSCRGISQDGFMADSVTVDTDTVAVSEFVSLLNSGDSILLVQRSRTANGTNYAAVQEMELVRAIEKYDKALEMSAPDSLRAACVQSRKQAMEIVTAVYHYLQGQEQFSRQIEAPERANDYKARWQALKPYVLGESSSSASGRRKTGRAPQGDTALPTSDSVRMVHSTNQSADARALELTKSLTDCLNEVPCSSAHD